MNADGTNRHLILDDTGGAGVLAWSPDGTKIAFHSSLIGNLNIFVVDSDGSNFKTLTNDKAINAEVGWTPDSTRIAFSNSRGISAINADGTNASLVIPLNRDLGENAETSPDLTEAIVRTEVDRPTGLFNVDLVALSSGARMNLLTAVEEPGGFVWAPDGQRLAFVEGINGKDAIKLIGIDGTSPATLLSDPLTGYFSIIGWTHDGKNLVYLRHEIVSRSVTEERYCFVALDDLSNHCFDSRFFPNQDGPSSPALLLN
jgi:TolB protein